MTKDQILAEALKLDPRMRGEIADALWESLSDDDQADVDAAWLAEAKRRDDAFANGKMTAAPVQEVIDRVRSRGQS